MLACATLLLARRELAPGLWKPVAGGVTAAWATSTVSVAALAVSRGFSPKAFWWAFGGGMALRVAVMAGLMVSVWKASWERQGALLGSYALGILFLLLLEYKNLAWE